MATSMLEAIAQGTLRMRTCQKAYFKARRLQRKGARITTADLVVKLDASRDAERTVDQLLKQWQDGLPLFGEHKKEGVR